MRTLHLCDDNIQRKSYEAAPNLRDDPAAIKYAKKQIFFYYYFFFFVELCFRSFVEITLTKTKTNVYPNDKRIAMNVRLSMKQEGSSISHCTQNKDNDYSMSLVK